ncbi:hypothetical protein N7478_010860 [Penicillium angulare]|uniref:uncharacterized protein n=1 Tax=Penicillium angulare TaxID=116970 RepID=UPI00253F8A60|nr:uncharacterized protein N7478_010860 [Penicillium angulare]KAJ5263255.1 hypothetical protein N7478_010860 [Penicillium angulare]
MNLEKDANSIMQSRYSEKLWDKSLYRQLCGDIGAATASAALVSPAVTIIDRAFVEKSLLNCSILRGLKKHTIAALKTPHRFIFSVPFGLIWTLYAATYTVANGSDTICKKIEAPAAGIITFVTTTLVNVPLGVWKDMKFAQAYGIRNDHDTLTKITEPIQTGLAKKVINPKPNGAAARAATAMFLLRDSVTIFGCFTLAPRMTEIIPDDLVTGQPEAKLVIAQLTVPVLTQVVATPMHLLALDLYMRQDVKFADRLVQSQRYLPSSTVMRCFRIIPAFGFGCLANMELRSFFHRKLNV